MAREINGFKDFHVSMEKFREAIRELFGDCGGNSGAIGDRFGGTLMYVYLPPTSKQIPDALKMDLELVVRKGIDEKVAEELALKAPDTYAANIPNKIIQATMDLSAEVMSPLYEAAGLKQKRYSITYEHNDHRGAYGAKVLLRKEIKNGVTVSRVVKQMNKGRPVKWDESKVEQMVLRARAAFKKRKYREPTLKEVATEISKRQPITEASLKMLLKRHGLSWRDIKKVT